MKGFFKRLFRSKVASGAAHHNERKSRKSALYLIGSSIQGLGLVIVQPFTLRVLDDEQWGLLAFAVATLQVGVVILASGLPLSITRSFFEGGNGPATARAISGFLSSISILAAIIVACLIALFSELGWIDESWHVIAAVLAMGVAASIVGAQAGLRAQGRVLSFVFLSIGMSLGANVMGFLFVTWISQTAVAYMSGYLLAVTAIAAFAFYLSPLSSPASAPAAVKDAMRVGAAILPHSIALLLLAQGAVILLSLLSGPSEAGDYAKVQIFALAPVTLLAALNNVWVPEIMSATAAERGPRLRKIVAKGSFAAFVICVLGSGFAALGTRVIAPGNEDLVPLAQILPLVSFGYFIYLIASSILFVHNRTHWMAALTPAVAFLGFLGAFFPARDGNVFVVGFVVILAYFVLGLTYCIMAIRRGSSEWQVGLYFVLLALAVIFCLAVLAVPNSLLGAYISAFYGVALASVAIAVACRVAKRLS